MTADASKIYDVCQISDRLFVLNPNFRRANFYAQQLRALALVEEMYRQGLLKKGERGVAVVGAGVAGLMVAAALVTVGATVTVVDRHQPLEQYRDANHREIHPNLIAWPFQPLRAITDLPFLNWSCGSADKVAEQIKSGWQKYFADKVTWMSDTVSAIAEVGGKVELTCESGNKIVRDRAVVTVGFLNERLVGTFESPSYWTPSAMKGPAEISVSGTGDGGLIDAAYQLFGIDAVATARTLAHALKGGEAEEDIKSVEAEAAQMADSGDISGALDHLQGYYSSFTLPPAITNAIAPAIRQNELTARLFYKERTAFSPYTAPINKALLALYTVGLQPRIALEKGELEQDSDEIFVVEDGSRRRLDSAKLLVRHGAEPAVFKILSKDQRALIDGKTGDILSAVTSDEYDVSLFRDRPEKPVAPSPTHLETTYHDELFARIVALVSSVNKAGGNVGVDRDRSGNWKVTPYGDVRPDVLAMFPFNVGEISISLADTPQPQYSAL